MTNEKLEKGNDLFSKIQNLKSQLEQVEKIVLLPALYHHCDRSMYEWAKPLDKKIRTYLKSNLTQELNRAQKEFEKL